MKYDVETFGLQPHLEQLYATQPRRLALRADTADAFRRWQAELRAEVVRLLGLEGRPPLPPPDPQQLSARDCGDYVEELHALEVGEEARLPVYLLRPKTPPPWKPILVFHGHDPSVQYVLGNYPDEATAQEQVARDGNYAQALARQGYLVCAPEQRGFGTRLSDQHTTKSCRHLAFSYLLEGRTLPGESNTGRPNAPGRWPVQESACHWPCIRASTPTITRPARTGSAAGSSVSLLP
ncbi:MAG: hypothetical protein OXB89_11425 [Anaerolineaceae bacterium]|nr:hypothetical protein [Anaerolineaceae bacterium]